MIVKDAKEKQHKEKKGPIAVQKASANAKESQRAREEIERDAFCYCDNLIASKNIRMKLLKVEYDRAINKFLIYFKSDKRIDFRLLARELASYFRAKVEFRQISAREQARHIGGLGICGRAFCCHEFLCDFNPISVKSVKQQLPFLSMSKMSGVCGRLMCCFKFEQLPELEGDKSPRKRGRKENNKIRSLPPSYKGAETVGLSGVKLKKNQSENENKGQNKLGEEKCSAKRPEVSGEKKLEEKGFVKETERRNNGTPVKNRNLNLLAKAAKNIKPKPFKKETGRRQSE